MSTRTKTPTATVTWELDGDPDEATRVLVDVETPLRPFGSAPTPPKGLGPMPALLKKHLERARLQDALEDPTLPEAQLPLEVSSSEGEVF